MCQENSIADTGTSQIEQRLIISNYSKGRVDTASVYQQEQEQDLPVCSISIQEQDLPVSRVSVSEQRVVA